MILFHLDPRFDTREVNLVVQAMQAWDDGTNSHVCFVPSSFGLEIIKTDQEPLKTQIEQKGGESSHMDPGSTVGLQEGSKVYLLTDKLWVDQDLYAASMHELGHVLGLDHYQGPSPSWMFPSIVNAPRESRNLTEQDYHEFCRLHGCDP